MAIKEILEKGKEDGHSEGSVDMKHKIEELTKENIWNFKKERNKVESAWRILNKIWKIFYAYSFKILPK